MSELNVGPDACSKCKAPLLRLCWSEQGSSPVVRHEHTLCVCCAESRLAKLEGKRSPVKTTAEWDLGKDFVQEGVTAPAASAAGSQKPATASEPEASPRPDPAPKPEIEPKAEAHKAAEKSPEKNDDYENWMLDELRGEATARDIHGRSQMDKADLVKALAKDDKDKAKDKDKTASEGKGKGKFWGR